MGSCHSASTSLLSKKATKLNKTVSKFKRQKDPAQSQSKRKFRKKFKKSQRAEVEDERSSSSASETCTPVPERKNRNSRVVVESSELVENDDVHCDSTVNRNNLPRIKIKINENNTNQHHQDEVEQDYDISNLTIYELNKRTSSSCGNSNNSSSSSSSIEYLNLIESKSNCLMNTTTMSSSKTLASASAGAPQQQHNTTTNLTKGHLTVGEINNNSSTSGNKNLQTTSSSSSIPVLRTTTTTSITTVNRFGFKFPVSSSHTATTGSGDETTSVEAPATNFVASNSSTSTNMRRNLSAFKVFPKPPASSIANSLKQPYTAPIQIKTTTTISNNNNHNNSNNTNGNKKQTHSSSLSSLSSSTSSNVSSTANTNTNHVSGTTTTNTHGHLNNQPKLASSHPYEYTIKKSNSQNSNLSTGEKKSSSSSVANNAASSTGTAINGSASGQTKRRLFTPYKLNLLNPAQSSAVSGKSTESNENRSANAVNVKKVSPKSETTTTATTTSVNQQPAAAASTLSKLKFSKMPVKSNLKSFSKLKTTGDQATGVASAPLITTTNTTTATTTTTTGTSGSIQREDSAYSSSTSSTNSSNEIDASASQLTKLNENVAGPMLKIVTTTEEEAEALAENLDQVSLNDAKMLKSATASAKSSMIMRSSAASGRTNSIRDSVGELKDLMLISSTSIGSSTLETDTDQLLQQPHLLHHLHHQKVRRTSSASLTGGVGGAGGPNMGHPAMPMFKPPSNLPPIENGEVIQMDIETYRMLMQDLQNFKTILHKLAGTLREPTNYGGGDATANNGNSNIFDFQIDDLQSMVNNPLLSSFYQHSMNDSQVEKMEQSTQTD